jgi:hypothetical protein
MNNITSHSDGKEGLEGQLGVGVESAKEKWRVCGEGKLG